MSLNYPLHVPAGQYPPFAVVTPTDHRAWVFIAAALGLTLTFMSLVIRAIIRYVTHTTIANDDIALLVSTLFAILQSSTVLAAGSDGLGQAFIDIGASNQVTLQRLYYASNLFYILSLCASRASNIILLRRMMANRYYNRLADILAGILGLWTFASLLAFALQCNLSAPWMFSNSQCVPGIFARWAGIEIVGAVLEACIFALTVRSLVWDLQVDMRRKIRIVFAFGARALILIFIGLRLNYFDTSAIERDPTLGIAEFVCWTQAEMNFSIIASTAPMLRVVLTSVPEKVGNTMHSTSPSGIGSGIENSKRNTRGIGGQFELTSFRNSILRRDKSSAQPLGDTANDDAFVPTGKGVNTSTVHRGVYEDEDSHGSQEMIIQKNISWQVSYDQ